MAPVLAVFLLAQLPPSAELSGQERQQRDEAQQAYERGQELMGRESFEEAAVNFKTAIRLFPTHWLAHYGLGQAYMALKRYPEAVQAYLSCRDVVVGFTSLDAAQQNELDRARDDEIRELKDSLQRVQAGKIKGISAFSAETQIQERLRVLEGSRLRGKDGQAAVPAGLMLGLGSAYFRSGQMDKAQSAFEEAVEIDPKLGPAHNNLAVVYMMSGRFKEAKEEVRRAEKAGMRVPDAFKQELERRTREAGTPR